MSGSEDTDARVRELDSELRDLESRGERGSARFDELSAERERLLNESE